MSELPAMKDDKGIPTLYVKGEPFFILGGQIHNSSASSISYMKEQLWTALQQLNLNTVIAPVYWEAVEAVEGMYDFELVESLIDQAREHGMHLVLLWFGLWKNGESLYVPEWMNRDHTKFFREGLLRIGRYIVCAGDTGRASDNREKYQKRISL